MEIADEVTPARRCRLDIPVPSDAMETCWNLACRDDGQDRVRSRHEMTGGSVSMGMGLNVKYKGLTWRCLVTYNDVDNSAHTYKYERHGGSAKEWRV